MLVACSEQEQEPPPPQRPPLVDAPPEVPRVPFAVDDFFYPSGCMGDCAPPIGLVSIEAGECHGPRLPSAQGNCYRFVYSLPGPETPVPKGWGGVLWQSPSGNWGAEPGQLVAEGATQVSFFAAGERGGEVVRFQAGGIQDPTLTYADTFKVPVDVTLTTSYEHYTIPLSEASYDQVLGAFGWIVESAPLNEPLVFYVDDIRWE